VAQSTESYDPNPLILANFPTAHWRVRRNSCAEQRGGRRQVQIRRDAQHEFLVHNDALGVAHVVVFTTSPNKKEDAFRLGAHEVVVSLDANEMQKHAGSFDFILDAVSADHDINAYLSLLARDGNLTIVGAPAKPLGVAATTIRHPSEVLIRHTEGKGQVGAEVLQAGATLRTCSIRIDQAADRCEIARFELGHG
jgi:threonine dehydrogenase-like Zn-dependent dehydrogenase